MQVWEITPAISATSTAHWPPARCPKAAQSRTSRTPAAQRGQPNTGQDAAATPNTGREAGDLLMHYDAKSGNPVPGASAVFLFRTHEGNIGLIEVPEPGRKGVDFASCGKTTQATRFPDIHNQIDQRLDESTTFGQGNNG